MAKPSLIRQSNCGKLTVYCIFLYNIHEDIAPAEKKMYIKNGNGYTRRIHCQPGEIAIANKSQSCNAIDNNTYTML